jgi:1-phosphatidylinositol-3-phosphate 5-kinase
MASASNRSTSPTTSAVFLPLGRRARRDSKASISTELDQDALNEALDHIHTAASQSQVLTVFNEYTEPPSATSKGTDKVLPVDLQGGLSSLYNKLKATVGGAKDGDVREAPPNTASSQERPASRTSSSKTSALQSPRVTNHDHAVSPDLHASQVSSGASVSKMSVNSPVLKSPSAPSPAAFLDPALTNTTIYADSVERASHSREGSGLDAAEVAVHTYTVAKTGDALPPSVSTVPERAGDLPLREVRVKSPKLAPSLPIKSIAASDHSRNGSDASADSRAIIAPGSPVIVQDDRSGSRALAGRQERLGLKTSNLKPSPLQLLGNHANGSKSPAALKPTVIKDGIFPGPSAAQVSSKDGSGLTLPPSRLSGIMLSHASSTNSAPMSRYGQYVTDGRLDGTPEEPDVQTKTRPNNKPRSKLLNREFWMRDENARDCFHCGESFSTFRRKHHCRTCGQIFDNKCTVLVSGAHFGLGSPVRVCKPCEAIIVSHDDDSSDYSDVDSIAFTEPSMRPRTPDPSQVLRSSHRLDDDNVSVVSLSLDQMAKTPTMNLPVRRAYDGDGSSKVLEFDSVDRVLPRPSSSRSLKHSHSVGHGHKRHHSRHQHIRNYKAYHDERAPFQRRTAEDIAKDPKASAFHRDSIIDPDLAQYLSDDASSGDEQSVMGTEKLSRSVGDGERNAISGLLAAVRKGRSRIGDRSIAGLLNLNRDADEVSIVSTRDRDGVRPSRRRNLSVASSVHQRATPRTTKERLQLALAGNAADDSPSTPFQPQPFARVSRMIRSASMHGVGAPAMELNRASIQHVHKLLQQLLRDANITKIAHWEEALVPILLRATDDVDPNVQAGDDIDIRNYVKLKKVPGGRPGDTSYISGLIFTKNVALKSMSRLIMSPRILIITFALEYSRHEAHFMSLDPVIRQEREYLENLVGRIATLKPDVLLAQRNVSGLALELLDKARIATVFNVKPSVLEAVSRCTGTRVIHSMDKLSTKSGQLGSCESFEVKTFVSEGRKKTYVYLSGCPPELGCTIAIRGADRRTLSKIKRITEFMIYVVYNLKLETCLMRDEWAMIPSGMEKESKHANTLSVNSTSQRECSIPGAGHEQSAEPHTNATTGTSTQNASQGPAESSKQAPSVPGLSFEDPETAEIPEDVPVPTFYEDMVDKHQTKILSASPFVKFMQPYLLMKARELERRVAYLKRLRDQDMSEEQSIDEKTRAQKFTLIQPDMLHAPLGGTSKKVREIIHAVHDAEYDKALHNYEMQKRQWETYLSGNRNLFDPYAHQNIVVLFSHVATSSSVPCVGPDLLAFNFYSEHVQDDFEPDCTLGQYVEDLCIGAYESCASSTCEKKLHEHHRQYVHGEAQITVFVQPHPAKMRGLQDVILMWSQCKICGAETTVTPMSASTWKYSFGKYLELSFWSADLHARAGMCPHDLHRDHLRYFGYKDVALRIHYDPIELLEIIVPRMRIAWKVDNDLRFRNEVFTRIEHRITRFMGSVKLRLKSINAEAILPENGDACKEEIDRLTKKANDDHATLIKLLQERYTNSKHWEIIPLNKAIRSTQEKVAEWDAAFSEFEQNFFPSEKDIRRLATLQLKKIFLDRDVSITSLVSDNEGSNTPSVEEVFDEKTGIVTNERPQMRKRTTTLSPQKTQNVLQSVLEEHASPQQPDRTPRLAATRGDLVQGLPQVHDGSRGPEDVEHLDLALPSTDISTTGSSFTSTTQAATPSISSPGESEESSADPSTPRAEDITDDPYGSMATPRATVDRRIASPEGESKNRTATPPLLRAHSTPAGSSIPRREGTSAIKMTATSKAAGGFNATQRRQHNASSTPEDDMQPPEKRLSERLGLSQLKKKGHSFIPRAISGKKESRVSNLAKHFEQLSREFERERVRERKLRAARSRQSRIYPLAAPKPIVEVYKDVDEAVDEPNNDHADIFELSRAPPEGGDTAPMAEGQIETDLSQTAGKGYHVEDTHTEATETEGELQLSSHAPSDAEDQSDIDESSDQILLPDSPEDLLRLSQEDLEFKELPKHERKSLMQMLSTFWAERSSSGWASLEYPMGSSEHVFADCDIIVREDEPSSIIAFALNSDDYKGMLHNVQEQAPLPDSQEIFGHTHPPGDSQADVMHSLLRRSGTHLKYQFAEGPAKMVCKIFFAEQFDAVRRKCGVADRIVESLSRCLKWDSKGGKTKSIFLKTLDDRFVLKSLSPIETQSFLKFAPNYFQIMSEAFFHELPSVIAKMLGFYQIIIKNPITGVEYNWYLLLMENLFYDRTPTRIFDLKGSMRNRKINATGERNEVLLDENMVEFIYESPLFAREHSKKLLRSSVHNDTLFLARQTVMDYSLMIAIDDARKELVVGIIDCIRTYTWDKKLESWIKDRGFAGGGKNRPTVTSPKEYKRRFREAMGRYVLEAPNCWHQFRPVKMEKRGSLKVEVPADKDEAEKIEGMKADGWEQRTVSLT